MKCLVKEMLLEGLTEKEGVRDLLLEGLAKAERFVNDAGQDGSGSPPEGSLQKHDEKEHPDGFNPETDTCKFRERIMEEGKELVETELLDVNRDDFKARQFEIIKATNPMLDDIHTGIRGMSDIKTFEEALDYEAPTYPDITDEIITKAKRDGKIRVFSSKPIGDGVFVSPSKMCAKDYAGDGKIYTEEVSLDDVAWINGDEGQVAHVSKPKKKLSEVIGIAAKGEQDEPRNMGDISLERAGESEEENATRESSGPNIAEEYASLVEDGIGDDDGSVKTLLVNCLSSPDKEVMDEEGGKRKRGRPRKEEDECRAKDPTKCWKHGFAGDILNEQKKERARKMDRINPRPTRDMEREFDIEKDLREIGWDLEDAPDSKAETEDMVKDLDGLRKEAGIKRLDETFAPFAAHRQKWKEYEETKKAARDLLKTAKVALGKHRLDIAHEMAQSLKKKPDEIRAKYGEVLDSYDALCDALCDIMDTNGNGDRRTDPTALHVEKEGYGMMSGEDFKAYQKRMRSLGKTGEIPETIKKIDEIVAQTERRWRSVAGISKGDFDIVKENFRKTFANLMKRCSLASNVSIAAVNGVLEDHLKTQHDLTPKGKHYDDGNYGHNAIIGGNEDMPRYKFTRKCFGTERGMKESKYEKYGCLHLMHPDKEDGDIGFQYGRNVIRWKPHKAVATMTFTDSLCLARDGLNYVNPCLVTNPSPCCFNPENQDMVNTLKRKSVNIGLSSICRWAGTPYVELQLHGEDQYNAEAIESISFGSRDDVRNLSKTAIAKILELKIPLFLGDQEIAIDEKGRIKRS